MTDLPVAPPANADQPFGQPPGTVRGILALTLGIGGFAAIAAFGIVFEGVREMVVGALIPIVTLVPQYYFKMREQERTTT
jgi:hypothetical protein